LIGFLPNPKPTILNISWEITYPNQKLKPFIRLRQNTLQLAAGMNGGANRVEAL
jgi:hypothetical protein